MLWISTGVQGTAIRSVEMQDGSFAIALVGLTPNSKRWAVAVTNLNFRVSASGRVLLRQGTIKLSEAKSVFEKASVTEMVDSEVFIRRNKTVLAGATPLADGESLPQRIIVADTQASSFLGLNYLGQRVFITPTGSRYLETGKDTGVVAEDAVMVPPVFLRVKTPSDIDLCADGFVVRAMNEYLRPDDLRRFCATIYGEDGKSISATDSRLHVLQEAVESSVFRLIAREHQRHGNIEDTFKLTTHLTDRLPTATARTSTSIELQQYSTPPSLSIAAQYVLGETTGLKVLEPTIGNASLLSTITGADIVGVEKDPLRYNRTNAHIETPRIGGDLSSNNVTLVNGDFLTSDIDGDFDAVIANPPFGGISPSVPMSGLNVSRLDHQILMRSLSLRKDDGKAVFVIAADRDNLFPNKGGIISGGSLNLVNWLTDHYETTGFEVAGSLYKKQGAGYPVRVIAVGRKRSADEALNALKTKEFRIESFEVARSPDELWALSHKAKAFLHESMSNTPSGQKELVGIVDDTVVDNATPTTQNQINDYQSPYSPMASTGVESTAMIPRNLIAPQQIAFARFTDECGDPLEYVKKELRWSDEDLFELAPEQIDAVALGIWNIRRGRALILADQTGMGKGRVVAAIARWGALNNIQTNFLSEKGSLFADFWRDITDIGSESLFNTFIMNKDTPVTSTDGENQVILVPKTIDSVRRAVIDSGEPTISSGYNLMLATYSQFNLDQAKSPKARYIGQASTDAIVVLDESHNAAGDSNTGRNITDAIINSAGGIYSSATYAKGAANMSVYFKAFPQSVDLMSLTQTLKDGGEPLLEVTSAMLCADGVYLRREHDLSGLKFKTIEVPDEYLARNVRISDQVSSILAKLSYLSGDSERVAKRVNKEMRKALEELTPEQRKGKRMGVSHTNFGSRLYSVSRQMALILGADLVADNALMALQNGQKPVIAMESTMESIVNELSRSYLRNANNDIVVDTDAQVDDGASSDVLEDIQTSDGSIKPLMVSDLLLRLLHKISELTVVDDYGTSTKQSVFSLGNAKESDNARLIFDAVKDEIDSMDEILAMPLDVIRTRIVEAGYSCGEISGRSTIYTLLSDADGFVRAVPEQREVSSTSKNNTIFEFNAGEKDALIITRSGCTGISIHASEKFLDQRQRVMIEAQIAANVSERMQFFGRVNRRGQVSSPEIWSVTSGLPWEQRGLAMQNIKMRKLSANTQSNRNSDKEIKGIPDVLNAVGNEVCKDFLLNNPEVALSLGLTKLTAEDEESSRSGEDGCYYANKLTGLICLLSVAEQTRIYEEITTEYDNKIEDLNNKGINPMDSKISDWSAKVVERTMVSGGGDSDSSFDEPVFAEKIEWNEVVDPIRKDAVVRFANASTNTLIETKPEYFESLDHMGYGYATSRCTAGDLGLVHASASGLKQCIRDSATLSMRKFVSPDADTPEKVEAFIEEALASPDQTFIKRIKHRADWLVANIQNLMPGCPIELSAEFGSELGVVMRMSVSAKQGQEHLPGKYHLSVAIPGKKNPVDVSLSGLIDDVGFSVKPYDYANAYSNIEKAKGGDITFSRWTLAGNLFNAVSMLQSGIDGRLGVYTTHDGGRKRAVICSSSVNLRNLMGAKIPVSQIEAFDTVVSGIKSGLAGSFILDMDSGKGLNNGAKVRISWQTTGVVSVAVPGTKTSGGGVFLDKGVRDAIGEFVGSRSIMSTTFTPSSDYSELKVLIGASYSAGFGASKLVSSTANKNKDVDDNVRPRA